MAGNWPSTFIILFYVIQTINSKECNRQNFKFVNAPLSVRKNGSRTFFYINSTDNLCADGTKYKWSVYKLQGDKKIYLPQSVLDHVDNNSLNYVALNLTSLKDEEVLPYTLAVAVSIFPKLQSNAIKRIWFFKAAGNVTKFEILGGNERVHVMWSGSLWLNITEGGGPPVAGMRWSCSPPLKPSSSSFTWEVKENYLTPGETYNCSAKWRFRENVFFASQIIKTREMSPVFEIVCVENCGNTDPDEKTVLEIACSANCKNLRISWSTDPIVEIKDLMVQRKNGVVFGPGAFKPNTLVTVVAIANGTKQLYTLGLTESDRELVIKCVDNCGFKIESTIVLKAQCQKNCYSINYEWDVQSSPKTLNWPFLLNEPADDVLMFPPYTFIEPTTVQVKTTLDNKSADYTFVTLRSNPVKLYLLCKENCNRPVPYLPVKIIAHCDNCNITAWELIPTPSSFQWDTTVNYSSFEIPAKTFSHGDSITIRAIGGNTSAVGTLVYIMPTPVIEIICAIKNCEDTAETPDPYRDLIFKVVCSKNCLSLPYKWWLEPQPEEIGSKGTIEKDGKFIVPRKAYRYGAVVKVWVKTSNVRELTLVQFKAPKPRLKIFCQTNCTEEQRASRAVVLEVKCFKHCYELNFKWTINTNLHLSNVTVDFHNETIIIKPNTFKSGETAKIEVHSNRGGYSSVQLKFRKDIPRLMLECKGNCHWDENELIIQVKCLHNCDNLVYQWYIETPNETFPFRENLALSNNNTVLRIPRQTLRSQENMKITVRSEGAESKFSLPVRRVSSAPKPELNLVCEPPPCLEVHPFAQKRIVLVCLQYCENLSIHWDLDPKPDWDKQTIREIGNRSLTILPKTYKNGDIVFVKAWSGDQEVTAILNYTVPPAHLTIDCKSNCGKSDPHAPVKLEILCYKNCGSNLNFVWTQDPPPNDTSKIQRGPYGQYLVINGDTYKDKDDVEVTVTWDTGSTTKDLEFVEQPADLIIRCIKSCGYNPFSDVAFEVVCLRHCRGKHPYEWTFRPKPDIPPNYYNFKKAVLIHGETYKFNEEVTLTVKKGDGYADLTIVFIGRVSELEVECIKNCASGNIANPSVDTKFRVKCRKDCKNLKYTWDIDQKTIYFDETVDMELDNENTTLIIKKDVFLNGSTVQISARSGLGVGSMVVHFKKPATGLRIICVSNCAYPSAYEPLKLNVSCYGECGNNPFIWGTSPPMKKADWNKYVTLNTMNSTLVLYPGHFKSGDSVVFIVTTGEFTAEDDFTFVGKSISILIECGARRSCLKLKPWRSNVIRLICHPPDCYESNIFHWTINPSPPGFVWNLDVKESVDNTSIIIKRGSFPGGFGTKFTVYNEKGPVNGTRVTFVERQILGFIECVQNCFFNPDRVTYLKINCTECYGVKWSCSYRPPPLIDEEITMYHNHIRISRGVYQSGRTVRIKCRGESHILNTTIRFRHPTWKGRCAIKPTKGVSGVTAFTVDCIEFDPPIVFRVYQRIPKVKGMGVLLDHGNNSVFSNLLFAPGKGHIILVSVGNHWDNLKIFPLAADVQPFARRTESRTTLKKKIYAIVRELLRYTLKCSKCDKAIQLSSLLEDHLHLLPSNVQFDYRHHILDKILSIANKLEPTQVLSYMVKVVKGNSNHTEAIIHLMMEIVRNCVVRLHKGENKFTDYSRHAIRRHAETALNTTGRIVAKMHAHVLKTQNLTLDPNYLHYREADRVRHFQYITDDIVRILEALSDMLQVPGYTQTYNNIPEIEMTIINKRLVKSVGKVQIGKSYVTVENPEIPPQGLRTITVKVASVAEGNPYWWDRHLKSINTPFIYAGINVGGTKLKTTQINVNLDVSGKKSRRVYSGTVEAYKTYVIEVKALMDSALIMNITFENSRSKVDAVFGKFYPVKEYFSKFNKSIFGTANYYRTITIRGPYYIGFYSTSTNKFTITYANLQCFSWHTREWRWQIDYCTPSTNQSSSHLSCICSKLSLYSGNVSLPEMIKKEPPVNYDFERNYVKYFYVFTITVIVVTFLLTVLWQAFKNDKANNTYPLYLLTDNNANDREMYLVAVQTGNLPGSGTTARVAIQLFGTTGKSRVHLLNPTDPQVLQWNSSDLFILMAPQKLGSIKLITIWHDSYGSSPHWYCETIVVRHVATEKKYVFLISRWFSLLRGNGITHGIFYVKQKGKSPNLKIKLSEALRKSYFFLGYWTGREYPPRTKENIAVTTAGILVIMTVCLMMIPNWQLSVISAVVIIMVASISGLIVTIVIDLSFRYYW